MLHQDQRTLDLVLRRTGLAELGAEGLHPRFSFRGVFFAVFWEAFCAVFLAAFFRGVALVFAEGLAGAFLVVFFVLGFGDVFAALPAAVRRVLPVPDDGVSGVRTVRSQRPVWLPSWAAISSGVMSLVCVANDQRCPNGS